MAGVRPYLTYASTNQQGTLQVVQNFTLWRVTQAILREEHHALHRNLKIERVQLGYNALLRADVLCYLHLRSIAQCTPGRQRADVVFRVTFYPSPNLTTEQSPRSLVT